MPVLGKNRRPMNSRLARRLIAVGTGSAALAIPLVAATSASAATPSAQHVAAESAPAATGATQKGSSATYTVVSGDSLSKIAQAHSVGGGWKKLYQDNREAVGGNPSLILPGLKLTLGEKAASEATAGSTAGHSATQADARNASTGATTATPATTKTYANNLDGWIKQSLDIMSAHNIPGTYDGIYRNVMRESSGNPQAINNWDSNAVAGTPSKGLLQVIAPTFQTYHVAGTSMDSYDPVANITAACNYAAATYGSIDNVNGPY
ncbi:LysM peptidoglycan-binding domain-containing protein [Streptomyces sp. NBC_01387]|uniref:transglycosylase SLT domain-containing protein n=1 Tax=unclassified Streptomyces TaxID=2593676 RepID=UPI0020248132|nr:MULTISPECIES: LysM peptidoglycan-binding domain-containing protein [unclassified Streptomyces]MCX4553447.1 LysM peptidoglycan-binding domain-containing protein [Streptomyces sp. NBC_01500]WSC18407.1 LysM peptidoglycan-binding domain-containing protein [Streptomyces sp. NBC_01766]WSV52448.1 LysM peptidoglycan-binding domain-containing protein [Streptomyces sp. NBC_01014]